MAEKNLIRKTNFFRYGFGMLGTSIPINMFRTFAVFFYVDRLSAVTFEQFALITASYTFLDAIDNPVYGFLSDRTRTPWGRRRPWLIIGTPLLILFYIMFFNPPSSLAPGSAFSYVIITYMLTGTLDSLINTNYSSLFPELFRTDEERAKTNITRQIFQLAAMVLSIALTPVITDAIGFSATAYIYGIISLAVIWFMAFGVREDKSIMDMPKPGFFESLRAVLINPKFWAYGVTNATFTASISLVQAGVPFYVKYFLGRADGLSSTLLLGAAILSAMVFLPLWFMVIKKLSVTVSWRTAMAILTLGILPLYFTSSIVPAIITVVILGFGMAGVQASMDLVSARILDEDAEKYGLRREGIYSSLLSVLNKSNGLIISGGYIIVDKLFGFKSGDIPGPRPEDASRFLVVIFPAVLMLTAFSVSFLLKFRNKENSNDNNT